jgi:hypothetical protein
MMKIHEGGLNRKGKVGEDFLGFWGAKIPKKQTFRPFLLPLQTL